MILGVDHVALSCHPLDAAVNELVEFGYQIKFAQRGVENNERKKGYQNHFLPLHDLAFLQRHGSVSIELTDHGMPPRDRQTGYEVLIRTSKHPALDSQSRDFSWEGLSAANPIAVVLPHAGAHLWWEQPDTGSEGIAAIAVGVSDIERSLRFWHEGLGATIKQAPTDTKGKAHIRFVSPLPSWCLDVMLFEAPPASQTSLDDAGFPCLALISNRPEDDIARALQAGGQAHTEPFDVVIDGKMLRIAFLRGPDGELVELLNVPRPAKTT